MHFYESDEAAERIGKGIAAAAQAEFAPAGLAPAQWAMTLLLPGGGPLRGFGHRGDAPAYPASVIKLFYLVAAQAWLEAGRLAPGPALDRALAAMIRVSSNDAANHLVDLLTGTTGGPELPPGALRRWLAKRQAVNRYFAGYGWPELAAFNAAQKTWDEGPYGREWQSRQQGEPARNRLTTDAAARLLLAIDEDRILTPARCAAMRDLLARDLDGPPPGEEPDNQIAGFLGAGLPRGSRLWSKAGWTSDTRHDAANIRLPDGTRFTLVVFTEGRAQAANLRLLPFVAARAAELVSSHGCPHPGPLPQAGEGGTRRAGG